MIAHATESKACIDGIKREHSSEHYGQRITVVCEVLIGQFGETERRVSTRVSKRVNARDPE